MLCNDNRETHMLYTSLASRKTLRKKGWLEMTEYSFVLDINDKKLAPCNINKAWYLIRKNKTLQKSKRKKM